MQLYLLLLFSIRKGKHDQLTYLVFYISYAFKPLNLSSWDYIFLIPGRDLINHVISIVFFSFWTPGAVHCLLSTKKFYEHYHSSQWWVSFISQCFSGSKEKIQYRWRWSVTKHCSLSVVQRHCLSKVGRCKHCAATMNYNHETINVYSYIQKEKAVDEILKEEILMTLEWLRIARINS